MVPRDKGIVIIGIGLLILSSILGITLASPHILTATQWQQNPTCLDMLACWNSTIDSYTIPPSNEFLFSSTKVAFTTKDAFYVNNPIYYEISLNDTTGNIQQAYYLIGAKSNNFQQYENKTIEQVLREAKVNQELIDLHKISDNLFYRKGLIKFPNPVDIELMEIVIFKDGSPAPNYIIDTQVTLDSQKVGSDAIQSHAGRITNETVIGLTYLGIALAPALLGADMILRVIFEGEKPKENKESISEDTHLESHEPSQV